MEDATGVELYLEEEEEGGAAILVGKHGGITITIPLPASVLNDETSTVALSVALDTNLKLTTLSHALVDMLNVAATIT